MMARRGAAVFAALLALAGAAWLILPREGPRPATPSPAVSMMTIPASPDAASYTLTRGAGGRLTLSWVETGGEESVLRASTLDGTEWGNLETVARGGDWFVNWADRPSVVALADGARAAHWLENNAGDEKQDYSYGIEVAFAETAEAPWRSIFEAGREPRTTNDYTGFVSFLPGPESFLAAWLEPPPPDNLASDAGVQPAAQDSHEHPMSLRVAEFDLQGEIVSEDLIDADVCTCCPLSLASTSTGAVLAYRDRMPGEVRDISIVRRVDGRWTEPRLVHSDGWVIPGCPTNGPAVAAEGDRVAVAWFTGVNEQPEVRLAISRDGAASFGAPVRISQERPLGYAGVVLLDDGSAAVSWQEAGEEGGAPRLLVRRVSEDGVAGPPVVVAETMAGRGAGMPQLARSGDHLVLVWREDGGLRSALISQAGVR